MGYENAPACIMLATACACCGRDLLDSESVNAGMGPTCREKHGYNAQIPEDSRALANKLVHGIACDRSRGAVTVDTLQAVAQIEALGLGKLASILRKRLATVRLVETDGRIAVFAPYSEAAVPAWRKLPGRRWDSEGKCNTVAATPDSKLALLAMLREFYPGALAYGAKGPFQIPGKR